MLPPTLSVVELGVQSSLPVWPHANAANLLLTGAHAETVILGLAADKKSADQMWARLDFNGNGIVSMAELDKVSDAPGVPPSLPPASFPSFRCACPHSVVLTVHAPPQKTTTTNGPPAGIKETYPMLTRHHFTHHR